MNNPFGLVDGGSFRIVNVGDNSVIELNLQGNTLITRPPEDASSSSNNNNDSQTFCCRKTDSGDFIIFSKLQNSSSVLMVFDYLNHRKILIQRKQSSAARDNQKWVSEHAPNSDLSYFLLSAPDRINCLRNMGLGKQIMIVPKKNEVVADLFAHWKLERLDPVLRSQQIQSVPQITQASQIEPQILPAPQISSPPQIPIQMSPQSFQVTELSESFNLAYTPNTKSCPDSTQILVQAHATTLTQIPVTPPTQIPLEIPVTPSTQIPQILTQVTPQPQIPPQVSPLPPPRKKRQAPKPPPPPPPPSNVPPQPPSEPME